LSRSLRDGGGLHAALLRVAMPVCYRLADVRIAVSQGVANDCARLSVMPRQRWQVIYNPAAGGLSANGNHPPPPELAKVTGPLILAVGTLKAVKNFDLLIDAFSRLPTELDATLCILGEGSTRPQLETLVRERGLSGRVLLPGFRLDPAPWYAHARAFVLSSDHEGFGNVIVEAMEHGVSIVSTDCPGGPREILRDGEFGRLVPMRDPDAMSVAIREALEHPTAAALLVDRAREFSVHAVAKQYIEVLGLNRARTNIWSWS
jgi:glycosyltransferase involved in cell wall biosynthesis